MHTSVTDFEKHDVNMSRLSLLLSLRIAECKCRKVSWSGCHDQSRHPRKSYRVPGVRLENFSIIVKGSAHCLSISPSFNTEVTQAFNNCNNRAGEGKEELRVGTYRISATERWQIMGSQLISSICVWKEAGKGAYPCLLWMVQIYTVILA